MGKSIFNGVELAESTQGWWSVAFVPGIRLERSANRYPDGLFGNFISGSARGKFLTPMISSMPRLLRGAAALCIEETFADRIKVDWNIPVLLVADTLKAYQAIANRYKKRFGNLRSIAITGSVGKNQLQGDKCVRSWSRQSAKTRFTRPEATTNNQVGVPQNLLNVNPGHRFCILEMGTNHFGEIEPLSRTLEPDVALINSIAPCHLEAFGDLRGVAREKCEIFAALKPDGTAVIPADCPEVDYLVKQTEKFRTMRFGADVEAVYHGGNLYGKYY